MTTPSESSTRPVRPGSVIELDIAGMTCASCAARIEKKLNRLDGVTATVNYATEQASVTFPAELTPTDLIQVVTQTGYAATVVERLGLTGQGLLRAGCSVYTTFDDVQRLIDGVREFAEEAQVETTR